MSASEAPDCSLDDLQIQSLSCKDPAEIYETLEPNLTYDVTPLSYASLPRYRIDSSHITGDYPTYERDKFAMELSRMLAKVQLERTMLCLRYFGAVRELEEAQAQRSAKQEPRLAPLSVAWIAAKNRVARYVQNKEEVVKKLRKEARQTRVPLSRPQIDPERED